MKRTLFIGAILLLIALCVFPAIATENVDYGDERAFEEALNRGENLEGRTVRFVVSEVHPDSSFGYDLWSGEHLNFVSPENPDANVGDELVVRATKIVSTMGSWIIYYEKVEAAADTADTVFGEPVKATPTPAIITPVVTADGATAEGTVPIWIPSIESVTLTGEYAFPDDYNDTFRYVLFFRNDSEEDTVFEVKATARDAAGNILGVSLPTMVCLCPGCESCAICYFDGLDYYDVVGINYEMTQSDTMKYYKPAQNMLTVQESNTGDKVIVSVTNAGTEKIDSIRGNVFFFSGDKMVKAMSNSLTSLDGLGPGIPTNIEFPINDIQYDSTKVIVEAYNHR